MRKLHLALAVCAGGVLLINAAAVYWVAGPLAAPGADPKPVAASAPPSPTATPAAAVPREDRPRGVRDAEAALSAVVAQRSDDGWPTWCGSSPEAPWTLSGITGDGAHVAIVVASAGDGARLWREQSGLVSACSEFSVIQSSASALVMRREDVPVTWAMTRAGDVLVSVHRIENTASAAALEAIAHQVADAATVACLNTKDSDETRNPWRPGYKPWHPAVTIVMDAPGGPRVSRLEVSPRWSPPKAKPQPQLAPLVKPTRRTNQYTTVLAPTLPAPVLIDPSAIPPPDVSGPAELPPARPPLPQAATAYLAREDTLGPGCGWAFADTVPAKFDVALPSTELQDQLDAAFVQAGADSARWLVWAIDANKHASEDAATRAALAAWALYEASVVDSEAAWLVATDEFNTSLTRWFEYSPPGVVPIIPSPTPSPPVPSVEPSPSPVPSTPSPTPSVATS